MQAMQKSIARCSHKCVTVISASFKQVIMRSKISVLLLLILCIPNVTAAIDSDDGGGELWFSCDDIDN